MAEEQKETVKKSPFQTIWNGITWALIGVVMLAAVALVGVRLFGLTPYTVLSGSMEPTYHTGSIVYVKKVDYHDLKVGDPITFMLDEDTIATHRIVEVVWDEEEPETIRYRTKGDANDSEDAGLVHYKNVIGRPVFSIPYLGYAADYIQHPPGTYIIITGCAMMIFLMVLPDLFRKEDDKFETEESEDKNGK